MIVDSSISSNIQEVR